MNWMSFLKNSKTWGEGFPGAKKKKNMQEGGRKSKGFVGANENKTGYRRKRAKQKTKPNRGKRWRRRLGGERKKGAVGNHDRKTAGGRPEEAENSQTKKPLLRR